MLKNFSNINLKITLIDFQRIKYDLTAIQERNISIVCIIGPLGTQCEVYASMMSDRFGFYHINVTSAVKEESIAPNERAVVIREKYADKRPIPDNIILELIKERMLENIYDSECGFVISGFPLSPRQAKMFETEVGRIKICIQLNARASILAQSLSSSLTKSEIKQILKGIRNSVKFYSDQLEKISLDNLVSVDEVFLQIETIVKLRLSD